MTDKEKSDDCIRYCIIKARSGDTEKVLRKISKALIHSDMTQKSIHECIVLLQVLEKEMRK